MSSFGPRLRAARRPGAALVLAQVAIAVALAARAEASRSEAWRRALEAARWLEEKGLRARPVASGLVPPGKITEVSIPAARSGDIVVVVGCSDARAVEVRSLGDGALASAGRRERVAGGVALHLSGPTRRIAVTVRSQRERGAHVVVVLGSAVPKRGV